MDNFDSFNPSIWHKENNHIHCALSCVFVDEDYVQETTLGGHANIPSFQKLELSMSWKSGCLGRQCCNDNGECSPHSTGVLTSKHSYSYGLFGFLLRPTAIHNYTLSVVWSCAELRGKIDSAYLNDHHQYWVSISLCFPSNAIDTVILIHRYGDSEHKISINLGFRADRFAKHYYLEWLPDQIGVYVNDLLLAIVKQTDRSMIPDQPMKIKVYMTPVQKSSKTPRKDIYKLDVYQIFYKRLWVDPEKTELFLQRSWVPKTWKVVYIVCTALLVFRAYLMWQRCKTRERNIPQGYEMLSDDHFDDTYIRCKL